MVLRKSTGKHTQRNRKMCLNNTHAKPFKAWDKITDWSLKWKYNSTWWKAVTVFLKHKLGFVLHILSNKKYLINHVVFFPYHFTTLLIGMFILSDMIEIVRSVSYGVTRTCFIAIIGVIWRLSERGTACCHQHNQIIKKKKKKKQEKKKEKKEKKKEKGG